MNQINAPNKKLKLLTFSIAIIISLAISAPLFFMIRTSLSIPPTGTGFYIPNTWTLKNYLIIFNQHNFSIILKTFQFAFEISICATALSFGIAVLIKNSSTAYKTIFFIILIMPKLFNPLVIILGLQKLLGDHGLINESIMNLLKNTEPLNLIRNHIGALIGEIYLIIPLTTILIYAHLVTINDEIHNTAKGLGANKWQVFIRIYLPLSYPGIYGAWIFSMIWGLGAFLGPLFLGSPAEYTISNEIYHQFFEIGNWPKASTWAIFLTISMLAFMIASSHFTKLPFTRSEK